MINQAYDIFNAPKGKDAPHGEHIYTWEYLDENGKLQTDSKNVKEYINSFLPMVDYKKQIARGELDLNENISITTADYSRLPDNTVDIYNYFTALASLSQKQVTELVQQANQASKNSIQTKQTSDQASLDGRQTNSTVNANQPTNRQSTPNNDVGGTK